MCAMRFERPAVSLPMDVPNPFRSVGTQTPTERLQFIFPDPFDCTDDRGSSFAQRNVEQAEEPQVPFTPSEINLFQHPFRQINCNRNLLLGGGMLPDVVPGKNTGRRSSDGMITLTEVTEGTAESVGQQLRSIGDDFDRTRTIQRSRSLSLVPNIFLHGRRRLSSV